MVTGIENVALGAYSLNAADNNESRNTAVGYAALYALNGDEQYTYNVAMGYAAGYNLTTGIKNTFIGSNACGNGAVTGNDNTTIGYGSGYSLTSGAANTFLGDTAGYTNATGLYNTAVGYKALEANVDGDKNTVVGNNALITANNDESRNTAIGYNALYSMDGDTANTHNTAVGAESGYEITTGINNTLIGYSADVDVATQSNQTVIGNGSVFKLLSKEYTCDHADGEDGKSAASEASPLKLPAYSIIKSISVIIKTLSNLGTFNVALYHSTDTSAPADDTALGGTPVEVLGAGASDTCSGNSASAVDIALGSGAVVKQSYYNAYGGAGLPVGTADRYIHVGQAGTSNGDTDPSTAGVIKVLVEYVGLD